MNNEKENILIDPRSDIEFRNSGKERRKGIISEFCLISCTKMRSFSSVGSVGRFSPHLHPFFRDRFRFYSFIFSTSSSAISTVYIHIYIYIICTRRRVFIQARRIGLFKISWRPINWSVTGVHLIGIDP